MPNMFAVPYKLGCVVQAPQPSTSAVTGKARTLLTVYKARSRSNNAKFISPSYGSQIHGSFYRTFNPILIRRTFTLLITGNPYFKELYQVTGKHVLTLGRTGGFIPGILSRISSTKH